MICLKKPLYTPDHIPFMHFCLPFAAGFVSDFLHTLVHTHKPIFGNRFAAFLWFHMHFSTGLEPALPQGHDRSDMPIAASVVDFPSPASPGSDSQGKILPHIAGKSAKKRSAQIFTCGWESRKLFHCIQSWSQDEFIDFGMLYPQCC